MELKYTIFALTFFVFFSFNRTFMELKLIYIIIVKNSVKSFNRTFMELKCKREKFRLVLIQF